MQFQIPQFIEEEDKLFGPLTFKQFIYVAGGAGAIFIIYSLIPWTWLAFLIIVPVGVLSALLAFKPINNRSFEILLEAAFHFFSRDKLYLWRREYHPKEPGDDSGVEVRHPDSTESKAIVGSQLDELSWNLEVGNQKPRNRG
jgi:hypothetical protein